MAIKTFTAGSVLTASDTNTYLANAGLVYVTSQTATSGTQINVTGCFSSTYDAYRIIVNNVRFSAGDGIVMQLLSGSTPAATNYFVPVIRFDIGVNSINTVRSNGDTSVNLGYASNSAGTSAGATFDVVNPFSAVTTSIMGQGSDSRAGSGYGAWSFSGVHNAATSYDGIRIGSALGSATFASGNIIVYGYRKA